MAEKTQRLERKTGIDQNLFSERHWTPKTIHYSATESSCSKVF